MTNSEDSTGSEPLSTDNGAFFAQLKEGVRADPTTDAVFRDTTRRIELLEKGRRIRKKARLTQAEVAAAMATTQSAVSDIETGRVDAQLQTFQRYARAIGRRFEFKFAKVDDHADGSSEDAAINQVGELALSPLLTTLVAARPGASTEDISKAIPLSESFTKLLLDRLEDRGAVRSRMTGHRRVYSFDYEAANLVGVSIEGDQISSVLVDMNGKKLHSKTVPLADTNVDSVLNTVVDIIAGLHKVSEKPLIGVGVCIAGVVTSHGDVKFAPELQNQEDPWSEVKFESKLRDVLHERLGISELSVVVENDANALAILEYLRKEPSGESVITLLISDTGTGAGVMIDGHLVRGAHSSAGEGGHTIVDPSGPKCRANLPHRGCLETVASVRSILDQLDIEVNNHEGFAHRVNLADQLVRSNDANAIDAFNRSGHFHGQFLAGTILLLDPARIVVYGPPYIVDTERFACASYFQSGLKSALADATARRSGFADETPIRWMQLVDAGRRDDMRAVAASATAFWDFLKQPAHSRLLGQRLESWRGVKEVLSSS
ncbi:MAG: ROK family protein [Mycolicibacterium neoaurum]|uniref:ROK family protein n=1 Tax=Mycolicibacterium neoaurum TaxID=1795 RepID=UPI002FF52010